MTREIRMAANAREPANADSPFAQKHYMLQKPGSVQRKRVLKGRIVAKGSPYSLRPIPSTSPRDFLARAAHGTRDGRFRYPREIRSLAEVHAHQEFFVCLGPFHPIDEEFHGINGVHVIENAAENPDAAEFFLIH